MAQDATAVVQTRDMITYVKPYLSTNTLPTIAAYKTAWTGYTDIGYTEGGLTVSIAHAENAVGADQAYDPLFFVPTSRTITMMVNAKQMQTTLIQEAAGMGAVVSVSPVSGTRGSETMTIDGSIPDIAELSVGVEFLQRNNEAGQALIIKGMPNGTVAFNVGDPAKASVVPVQVQALVQTSSSDPVFLYRSILPAAA